MQLNLRKIDERIQKLQEIRRIASDPELVSMLFEFMASEDVRPDSPRMEPMQTAKVDVVSGARQEDTDIVNQVVKGMDAQGSGLWSRKRG